MKAHLINMHLLVSRSRSSARVKVKYQLHFSKNGRFRGISVSQTHLVLANFRVAISFIPNQICMQGLCGSISSSQDLKTGGPGLIPSLAYYFVRVLRETTPSCMALYLLNPSPHDKMLDQTKLKAFADDKVIISFFDRVENIVGKDKLLVQAISPFSTMF